MRVLVTGCAGFVASHICDTFLADGHTVIGMDNLSSGQNNTPAGVDFIQADLVDLSGDFLNVDAVVHAAAYPDLRHNWDDRLQRTQLVRNGEMATLNLLEMVPDHVPFVFLSSASVYGSQCFGHSGSVGEGASRSSTIESPYAASKHACEGYTVAYAHKSNRPWHILRLVNVVGRRGHRGVIADFVRMAREGHIHAADDGHQRKSWVHAGDVAGAVHAVLTRDVPNGIYNVTSRERISWRDIIIEMGNVPFTFENRPIGAVGDPRDLHASGEKLNPWYRCEMPIQQGIQEALDSLGWVRPPFDPMTEPEEPAVP